jgi:hypothetical protein
MLHTLLQALHLCKGLSSLRGGSSRHRVSSPGRVGHRGGLAASRRRSLLTQARLAAAFSAAKSAAFMPALAPAGANATVTINLISSTGATIFTPDLKQLQLDVFNVPSSGTVYSQSMSDYRTLWVRAWAGLLAASSSYLTCSVVRLAAGTKG